ncbi:MAG: tetratricopeptide repeat protein, partial [Flavobacteriales bacterium]
MRTSLCLALFAILVSACGNGAEEQGKKPATGGFAGALAEVEQRILAEPDKATHFAERARLYEGVDSVRLAESDWKRAIALDSASATWHIGLGDLYYRKVRLPPAEEQFLKAIALDPVNTEARLKLSEMKLLQHQHKEAMTLANEALRIDPLQPRGYYLKGWIHAEAGDTALSISSYQTAVEQDPQFYAAYMALGLLHAAMHDPLALQYYNSALEIQPTSVEALYDKAIFAQDHGQDSLAIMCYDRIKAIEPAYPLAWYNTGYVLLEHKHDLRAARTQFNKAIYLLPDYTQAYYSRGVTYELEGRLDSALKDFKQALALAPGFTLAAEGLSRLQAKGVHVSAHSRTS